MEDVRVMLCEAGNERARRFVGWWLHRPAVRKTKGKGRPPFYITHSGRQDGGSIRQSVPRVRTAAKKRFGPLIRTANIRQAERQRLAKFHFAGVIRSPIARAG